MATFNPLVPYTIDASTAASFPYSALTNYNLSSTRLKTFPKNWAAFLNGSVYNLTGASIRFIGKLNQTDLDAAAIFNKTIGAGILVAVPASGLFTTTLAPSDTSALPIHPIDLFYEIQITDSGGLVFSAASGILTILPNTVIATP